MAFAFCYNICNRVATIKKCNIKFQKRNFDEELAKEYGVGGLTACPMLKEGQVFYADWECPKGFCNEAWKAIYQYVFTLAHGGATKNFIITVTG